MTTDTTSTIRRIAGAVAVAGLAVACTPPPPPPELPELPSLRPCPTGTDSERTPAALRDERALAAASRVARQAGGTPGTGSGQVVISTRNPDGSGDLLVVDAAAARATTARALADGAEVISVETNDTVRLLEPSGSVHPSAAPAGTTAPASGRSADALRILQWPLDRWNVESLWTRSRGAGTRVAVIDTGVQADHPDLFGQVLAGQTFLRGGTSRPIGTVDGNGHGTHVAGTIAARSGNGTGIAAVAPDTRIVPVKVLDDDGYGTDADIAYGIAWATNQGVDVINLSLGGPRSEAVGIAVHHAVCNGVVVVAAAGNSGPRALPSYPAAAEDVIGVAASDPSDHLALFSSRGWWVDVTAPGVHVLSTLPTSLDPAGYNSWSGTSMAAPHVAGVAALLASANPTWTPAQIADALTRTATDRGPAGRDDGYGYGVVDPGRALAHRPAPAPAG